MLGIFLDLETTGLDPSVHRIIEIAFRLVDLSSREVKVSYDSIVKQPDEVWEKHDPNSIQVNGFSYEKMSTGKPEAQVKQEVMEIFAEMKIGRGKAVFHLPKPLLRSRILQ